MVDRDTYVPLLDEPVSEGSLAEKVSLSDVVVTPSGHLHEVPPSTTVNLTLHIRPHYSTAATEPLAYVIADEPFLLEIGVGEYTIRHKQWSLCGRGASLIEAESDLVRTARIIAPAYLARPVGKMTLRALALKDFLLRVI